MMKTPKKVAIYGRHIGDNESRLYDLDKNNAVSSVVVNYNMYLLPMDVYFARSLVTLLMCDCIFASMFRQS